MKILGIDPGLAVTGFGFLDIDGELIECGKVGAFRTEPGKIAERLKKIFVGMTELLAKEKPLEVAIEEGFYGKNVKVALSLGQARGVILLACTMNNIPVFEYSPREVKLATVGKGSASKEQVGYMIRALLNMENVSYPFDIFDALAVAYCHNQRRECLV